MKMKFNSLNLRGRNIFFTSDQHFKHRNIIEYDNRPFKTTDEMDEELIKRYNEVVKPSDIVFHVGDFMWDDWKNFESIFNRLNGEKHIVWGNHDRSNFRKKVARFWKSTQSYLEISYDSKLFVLCHYPFMSWKNQSHGSINVHGHSHGRNKDRNKNQFDVGVNVHDYYPVDIEYLISIYEGNGYLDPAKERFLPKAG